MATEVDVDCDVKSEKDSSTSQRCPELTAEVKGRVAEVESTSIAGDLRDGFGVLCLTDEERAHYLV